MKKKMKQAKEKHIGSGNSMDKLVREIRSSFDPELEVKQQQKKEMRAKELRVVRAKGLAPPQEDDGDDNEDIRGGGSEEDNREMELFARLPPLI